MRRIERPSTKRRLKIGSKGSSTGTKRGSERLRKSVKK